MRKGMPVLLGLLAVVGCATNYYPYGPGSGGGNSSDSGSSFYKDPDRERRDCREKTAARYEKRGYNSDDAWAKAIRACDHKH